MKRYETGDIYAVKLRKPGKTTKRWKLHRLVVITASQLPEKGWITKVMRPLYHHHHYGSTMRIRQVLLTLFLLS